MDRASDYGSEGSGFDFWRARHKKNPCGSKVTGVSLSKAFAFLTVLRRSSLALVKVLTQCSRRSVVLREKDQDDESQHVGHDGEEVGVVTGQAHLVYQLITESSAKAEKHGGPER